MQNFENRLNNLLLLSSDWRTSALFRAEAQKLTADIMTRTGSTEPRATLARDLGGLKAVIETQDRWLRNQLMTIQQPTYRAPVQWMI